MALYRKYRHGFIADSDDEELSLSQNDGEYEKTKSELEEDAAEAFYKRKNRPGKKSPWPIDTTNELIDIICSDNYFSKRLIFTNSKTSKNSEVYEKVIEELKKRTKKSGTDFAFNVAQVRNKFKKCVSECKRAALTLKSASGIQRFQEEKEFGRWFNQLLPLVKSRESCQPEQAVEPSFIIIPDAAGDGVVEAPISQDSASSTLSEIPSTVDQSGKKRIFTPLTSKSGKKQKLDELINMTSKAIDEVSEQLKKDPVGDILAFLEKENEKAREHEMKLFSMLANGYQGHQPYHMQFPQQYQPAYQMPNQRNSDERREKNHSSFKLLQNNFSAMLQNLEETQEDDIYEL